MIVNRMPADAADQSEVLADVRRMLIDAGLDEAQTGSARTPAAAR